MIVFSGEDADQVWRQAAFHLHRNKQSQESRDQETREVLHGSFVITNPRQRLVLSRAINPAFAIAEVIWIMTGSNDLGFLTFWNPRMKRYSDDNESLHGAYGYRLRGKNNKLAQSRNLIKNAKRNNTSVDQIRAAYEALHKTPHSRQVVLQIWNSNYDLPNPNVRAKDIPCNLMAHLMVRNERLEWLQVMRSNDLIWGTPYNFIQFTMMQELFAGWLNVDVGNYVHISDSLHVYERHWDELDSYEYDAPPQFIRNTSDLRIKSFDEWEKIWGELTDIAILLSRLPSDDIIELCENNKHLPKAYLELVAVLAAEALRKKGAINEARNMIEMSGDYWKISWNQWAESKIN
jgi:thymidylate synthase